MKKGLLALTAGSLALNVALAAVVWSDLSAPPDLPPAAAVGAVALTSTPNLATAIDPDVWPSLISTDLSTFISRMQAAGFPAEIIRALTTAQLLDTYGARRRALDVEAASRPFWKNRPTDPKVRAALQQLDRDQEAALRSQNKSVRAILGGEEPIDPWSLVYQSRQFAGVPPEKVAQVRQLLSDYEDQRSVIESSDITTAADRAKLAAIDHAQLGDLAQLLTPSELMDYQLRNSTGASELRDRLRAFAPTEAEFRALYPLQQAFSDRFPDEYNGSLSPEEEKAREEAQDQLTRDLRATLSPERAADLDRASDYDYQQAAQLVARLDLPLETTNQLYTLQQDTQKRAQTLYQDRSLSADQRTQQLASLADEAKTKIGGALGATGLEAYRQYGGQWLRQLEPRKPAAVKQ